MEGLFSKMASGNGVFFSDEGRNGEEKRAEKAVAFPQERALPAAGPGDTLSRVSLWERPYGMDNVFDIYLGAYSTNPCLG